MLDYDVLHRHRKFLPFLVIHFGLVTEEIYHPPNLIFRYNYC